MRCRTQDWRPGRKERLTASLAPANDGLLMVIVRQKNTVGYFPMRNHAAAVVRVQMQTQTGITNTTQKHQKRTQITHDIK